MNQLLSLLQLADTALPIGGFSHSAGLETYVQLGIVHNAETAETFVSEMLSKNILHTDLAFVSLSYDAALANDFGLLQMLDDECRAVKLPREIREASHKLGFRLVKLFSEFYKSELLNAFKTGVEAKNLPGNYCIAFGIIAQSLNIKKREALAAFCYNAAAGMVTNSVKLVPLGQVEGQKILFSLQPLIHEMVEKSINPDKEMLGICCSGFDIRSMQHEVLYSRLYMS